MATGWTTLDVCLAGFSSLVLSTVWMAEGLNIFLWCKPLLLNGGRWSCRERQCDCLVMLLAVAQQRRHE